MARGAYTTWLYPVLVVLLALVQSACFQYGGRLQITIESEPSDLCFYVVPLIDWQHHGERAMLQDRDLENYKHCSTPKVLPARDYTYVIVMDCREGRTWEKVQPTMGSDNHFLGRCR